MSSDTVVRLRAVSKRFKLYRRTRDRLLDWLRLPPRPRHDEFWALRDVTCEVRRGECLGIIGPNGAGKSTLLKLLTGSLFPTAGEIELHGTVLSLLELGTGFTPELSGRQNVEQSARLLGFPPGYAAAHMREIESFAELGDYFERPVKFYSSGMLVRLAFSLFSIMQPEVFLVDEALAVGDLRFASRAFGRIRDMLDAGTTLLFVSHDLQMINQLCTRALWLSSGTVQMDGLPSEVTRAYQQFVVHGRLEESALPPPVSDASPAFAAPFKPVISLGSGWYPLEAYGGEVFRWAGPASELLVPDPGPERQDLQLEVEPALRDSDASVPLEVADETGEVLVSLKLSSRDVMRIPLAATERWPRRLHLRSLSATPGPDGRALCFRAFRWGWTDEAALKPIGEALDWIDPAEKLELSRELAAMRAALQRCAPVAHAPARITRVVSRISADVEVVRCSIHAHLTLDVVVEGLEHVERPVVGVQVRDPYERMIWTTRSDWQGVELPTLAAGDSLTVSFSTEKLLLGRGLYHVTVAVHAWPREDRLFHWVDGAWRFEVVESGVEEFKGAVDLGWQCTVGSPQQIRNALPPDRVPV